MSIVKIDISGIKSVCDYLDNQIVKLPTKGEMLVGKLADIGKTVAGNIFKTAQYDGFNDVAVTARLRSKSKYKKRGDVIAKGNAVAFIEYGSGVHYQLVHPWASSLGMVRGDFGYHLGRFDHWRYKGDPGTNGEIITEGKHKGEIRTHGNPPARAMYYADRSMRSNIDRVARVVFRK